MLDVSLVAGRGNIGDAGVFWKHMFSLRYGNKYNMIHSE